MGKRAVIGVKVLSSQRSECEGGDGAGDSNGEGEEEMGSVMSRPSKVLC